MKARRPILVTGGAGYIGSHVVLQLVEAGEKVVVLDDLSTGVAEAVVGAELVVGNVGDATVVTRLLRTRRIDTVMHFAARTIVPESVADPLRYYGNNTCATRNLLARCAAAGVRRSYSHRQPRFTAFPPAAARAKTVRPSRSIRTARPSS